MSNGRQAPQPGSCAQHCPCYSPKGSQMVVSVRKAAITLMTFLATCAGAADADMPVKAPIAPAPAITGWTFSLTPYFWAVSLNGSTTVKGRTTDVDAGFFDLLEHTQFPKDLFELAAFGEARYGRFALLTDIVYLKAGLGA